MISSYGERGAHGWDKTAQRTELLNERRQTKETIKKCKQEDASSSRREKSANSDSSDAPDAWGRYQKKAEEKIYKKLCQDWGNYGRQWYGKTGWDSSSSGSSSTRPSTHSDWYHRRAHYPDSAENDRSSKKPRTSGAAAGVELQRVGVRRKSSLERTRSFKRKPTVRFRRRNSTGRVPTCGVSRVNALYIFLTSLSVQHS